MPPQPRGPRQRAMPSQREEKEAGFEAEGEDKDDSFLLLQQSVTLGSLTNVDQLIAKIGEKLKLDTAHDGPASPSAAPGLPAPAGPGCDLSGTEPVPGEADAVIFCVCRDRGPSSPRSHSLHAVGARARAEPGRQRPMPCVPAAWP
ncbi:proto-oncogene FRAT1-like protein [Cricetulus griseus]|uniref:Proto-oncogene FRAT1-like protein n=1 Tax=Cricetulus griseus TaxID=10029 RepID=A0A061I060_CRIGR|nr:proto-oncogene FRAT1-like protein [Cricetulus griseus]